MHKKISRIRALAVGGMLAGMMLASGGCDFLVSPEQRYERAQSLVAEGEYRRALVELKNALQKQSDLHEARALLADVALWLGDPVSAQTELDRLPKTDGADPHADLRTRVDLAQGRFTAVLNNLSNPPANIKPARVELYRGLALQGVGKTPEAQQAFESAAKLDPALLEAQVGIAETMSAQGDLAGALALATKLTEQHPKAALAWYSQGSLFARGSKNEAAQAALVKAHSLAAKQLEVPRQASLLSALIELQLAARNLEGAKANLDAMNRIVAGSPLAALMTGRIAMASNDYTGAASGLRRLVNAAPQFTQARYLLGVALVAQGNLEQASQELSQVVEQAPQNLEARQLLAQVRMRLQDPDGALRVLVPAIEADSDNSRLTSLFEGVRNQAGADRQTIETLEKALEQSPNSRGLQVQLASAYLQSGAPAKAVTLLRRGSSAGEKVDPRRESLLVQAVTLAEGPAAGRAQVQTMLAAHGAEPAIMSVAAAFYARTGDFDKGRALLNDALAKNPKQPELLFTLARVEWTARRVDAARAALQKLIAIDPANLPAQLTLVELDLAQGNMQSAVTRLEALHQTNPKAVEPPLLLARLALSKDDTKRADTYINAALQAAPKRADVSNSAGLLYLESGRFDQALGMFQDGAISDASNPVLWLNLGRAQLGLNQRGPARESLQKALNLQPDWLPAVGALAFLEVQEGNGTAALNRLAPLKQKNPNDPALLALEGEVNLVLQRYPEAAQAYEAAARIRPAPELATKIYQARFAGRLPKPVEPMEEWSRAHPDNIGFRNMLADAYIKTGDRPKAVEQYQQILQRQPKHVPSLNNLAWLYYEIGDTRALPTAREAYALAPQSAAIMDTLGWILVRSGQLAEGLPLLEKAASPANAPAEIKYHHAAALARSGAKDRAKEQLSQLLGSPELFDSRAEAQQLLVELGSRE
ncbi:MAG: XrtA/PEP-CTERM system TPR-repeat protein PrsT [Steroidobacter sp.]